MCRAAVGPYDSGTTGTPRPGTNHSIQLYYIDQPVSPPDALQLRLTGQPKPHRSGHPSAWPAGGAPSGCCCLKQLAYRSAHGRSGRQLEAMSAANTAAKKKKTPPATPASRNAAPRQCGGRPDVSVQPECTECESALQLYKMTRLQRQRLYSACTMVTMVQARSAGS